MKLFLDCEFNGFGGELISMALVDELGQYFYEVLPCPHPVDWVKDNILPILGQAAIAEAEFKNKLCAFLNRYQHIHIIADWPEDLSLFTRALIVAAGRCMMTPPLTLELWMPSNMQIINSSLPHYALADARALANGFQQAQSQQATSQQQSSQ
ncbi:hypothetical protein EC844_1284 [Acinetobacter calcoaceticus]|uniref:Uncharacterized protein n=1 Tax=Acinetobacter calcoaceticus TaxID=471 RepID=A0A4R1XED0_ACICA|nr:hypothetical protein EC844_1284 [Acinetobacter calcoaceticus]